MAEGVWRTIKGRHVLIKEGQSLKDALKKKWKINDNKENKLDEEEKSKEVRNAIRSSYIYRDEYKSDEYMKQYREKYGDQSVDDAIKYYDDNYVTVKGTTMDSEGLTYNNILKKDEYPKEALEKYSKDMKELYDREKYSYDSVNYNKKANDLYNELQNSKQQSKDGQSLENIINEDKRTNNTMNRMKSIEDQQRYDRLYDRYKENGKSDAWIKDTLGDRPKTGLENATVEFKQNEDKSAWLSKEDKEWLNQYGHGKRLNDIVSKYNATGDIEKDTINLNNKASDYFYNKAGIYNESIDSVATKWAHDKATEINNRKPKENKTYPQLTRNGITYNITEHKDEGYYKGISASGGSFVGKSKEKYKIENPNDASDWGWIEKEEYDKLTSQGKLTDETDIARRIRKGKMNKDENTINDTYYLGDEKKGYYVQFQDVSTHEHEDINKYPRVSAKVKSNTWARVWKDGKIVYNNDAGRNSIREGKYEARANVASFLEGEKSYSTLVQSYMNAGFSKAQAQALAKYQLRRRK